MWRGTVAEEGRVKSGLSEMLGAGRQGEYGKGRTEVCDVCTRHLDQLGTDAHAREREGMGHVDVRVCV